MTQIELSEMLGVAFQTISKWENDRGAPDISQIVPLSRAFGVSTDTLFGVSEINSREEVMKIIKDAGNCLTRPLDSACLLKKYRVLQEGLKRYPNNRTLLMELLETGLPLAYPEKSDNFDLYDKNNGKTIYKECLRYASLIISHSENVNNVMRARMITVMLYCAYGVFDEAQKHIEKFPYRADLNINNMYRFYAHWREEYNNEIGCCQYANMYYIEAILNSVTQLAVTFIKTEQYDEAIKSIETELDLISCIFKDDEILPPVHYRGQPDLYMLLAEAYLRSKNREKALINLEKMVNYDTVDYEKITDATETKSPLLRAKSHEFYIKRIDTFSPAVKKLTDKRFDELKDDERYKKLLKQAGNIIRNK